MSDVGETYPPFAYNQYSWNHMQEIGHPPQRHSDAKNPRLFHSCPGRMEYIANVTLDHMTFPTHCYKTSPVEASGVQAPPYCNHGHTLNYRSFLVGQLGFGTQAERLQQLVHYLFPWAPPIIPFFESTVRWNKAKQAYLESGCLRVFVPPMLEPFFLSMSQNANPETNAKEMHVLWDKNGLWIIRHQETREQVNQYLSECKSREQNFFCKRQIPSSFMTVQATKTKEVLMVKNAPQLKHPLNPILGVSPPMACGPMKYADAQDRFGCQRKASAAPFAGY